MYLNYFIQLLNEIISFSFNVIDYIEVRHNNAPDIIYRDNARIFSSNVEGDDTEGMLNYRELCDYINV